MKIDKRIKACEFKSASPIIMNSMKFNLDIASCASNYYLYNSCITGIATERLHKNDNTACFIMESVYIDEEN